MRSGPSDRDAELSRRGLLQGLGAAALGGLAAGCATNPVTGSSEMMLLSEEEEIELGKKAFAQLAWQQGGPLRIDPATQSYLDGIVKELHQVSHRPNLPVDFTLESASEPNAWAIPGHTAMNRGLLQHLENEAQFAFVMGHEMGHVAARHSAARQSRATVGNAGLGILGVAVRGPGARARSAVSRLVPRAPAPSCSSSATTAARSSRPTSSARSTWRAPATIPTRPSARTRC